MQLFLTFRGEEINLPISYRHAQQGLLYHTLAADPVFATRLHDEGKITEDRSFKHFTFSPLTGAYRVEDRRIIFQGGVSMEVRSVDEYFIRTLAENLPVGGEVQLGKQRLQITKCRVEDRHLLAEEAVVQAISPIVVYQSLPDGHTLFFSPEDREFYASIIHNAQRKWRSLVGEEEPFALEVEPMPGQTFRRVSTRFKTTFLNGWQGSFRLRGLPGVLDMLYHTGLGAKSSQGFGMFRILRNEE